MVIGQTCRPYEPLEQILSKAGRMGDRQPDVLIEMEHLDPRPVDLAVRNQGLQEFEL
jgi:hypothetical protein